MRAGGAEGAQTFALCVLLQEHNPIAEVAQPLAVGRAGPLRRTVAPSFRCPQV